MGYTTCSWITLTSFRSTDYSSTSGKRNCKAKGRDEVVCETAPEVVAESEGKTRMSSLATDLKTRVQIALLYDSKKREICPAN